MMKKPTIFIVDSDLIDLNLLVLKIERKFNCTIFTFFDIEEVLIYQDITPDIFIIDEHTYKEKKEVIDNVLKNINNKSIDNQTKFVIYSENGLVDLHRQNDNPDEVDIIPIDKGYNSIQLGLHALIG